MNHFIIKARNKQVTPAQANLFLQTICANNIILPATIKARTQGFFAVSATQDLHVTLSVYAQELVASIVSAKSIDENNIISLFSKTTTVGIEHITIYHLGSEEAIECQEPRCTRPARKDYNGLKLCSSHYQEWLERADNRSNLKDRV